MRTFLASISESLAAKLIIALLSLVIIGGGISWYALIHAGKENLINEAVKDAASYSDLVTKSVRHSMLTFNRKAIQQTVDDLRSTRDVKGIKLFNGKGRIFVSSKHEEIGHQVDRTASVCQGCHSDPERPSETMTQQRQWVTYRGREGYNILTFIDRSTTNPPALRPPAMSIPRINGYSASSKPISRSPQSTETYKDKR